MRPAFATAAGEQANGIRTLTGVYFVYFLSFGICQPFLNLYFQRQGLSGAQIGVLSAMRPLTSILLPPLVGYLVDKHGGERRALAWLILAGVLPFYTVLTAQSMALLFVGMALFAACSGSIVPMLDANALSCLGGDRIKYGLMRRWGSFGYMVAVVATGQLGEALSIRPILIASGVLLAAAGAIALWHSRGETYSSRADIAGPWWREALASTRKLMRLPGVTALFIAGFLGTSAAAVYYTFFSIFADQLGMPEGLIGMAWGLAVASEITVLSLSVRILQRCSPKTMFTIGLCAATVRWSLYGIVHQPYIVLMLQVLHGFTFAALQVGAVTYLHACVTPEHRTSAQTMWVAVTGGLAGSVGALLIGPLADTLGLHTLFGISGGVAFLGVLVGLRGLR